MTDRTAAASNWSLNESPLELRFKLNGREMQVETAHSTLLAELLREGLGLTGTKVSCEEEICGSCTVLVGGRPVSSCTFLAYDIAGQEVLTVEGLGGSTESLHPLQRAFLDHFAFQCGFCTPGMLMTALALLTDYPAASRDETVHFMDGNLCRCTGYAAILDAIQHAQTELQDDSD